MSAEPSLKSELITEGEKFKIDKIQKESENNQSQLKQTEEQNGKEDDEDKEEESKKEESEKEESEKEESEKEESEKEESEKEEQENSQQLSINQSYSQQDESKSQSKLSKLQDFSGQLIKHSSKLSIAKVLCDAIITDQKSALQDLQDQIYQGTLYPLEHYEEIMKDVKCMWKKPFFIGHPAAGIKVRNWTRQGAQYLCYFQATYKLTNGTIIQGNQVWSPEGQISIPFKNNQLGEKKIASDWGNGIEETITLEDDEYAVEIIGRSGAWVDNIGVVTNKGRRLQPWKGGGGSEIKRVAPKGFHFATFGANNDGNSTVHCIYADILILPEVKKEQSYKLPLSEMRSVFKLIFDFLQFNDIVKLFLLCKELSNYRYDEYVITKIAEKIIYQCEIQSRQYLKLLIDNSDLSSKLNKHLVKIKNSLELTENKIRNPDGEDQFNGFTEVVKGGSGIKVTSNAPNFHKSGFQTSFSYGILGWKKQLSEVFSPEFIQDFLSGKAAIIAGCYMKANVFGSVGFIELKFYENDKLVSKDNLNLDSLQTIYKKYQLKYIHDVYSSFKPTAIELRVAGKDVKYWAGLYGAYISSIFCHGLVMHTQEQKDFIYRQ